MYKEYFGLKEPPFSIAPDPHYLYMSDNHREALAHLLYGINSDNGFVLLTGDVGTGKTTVCRCLLQQLPANSKVLVEVKDSGIGIPAVHIPHIFDAFYRVPGDLHGSGLGLSIVRTIIEAHGGEIWAESLSGKETTFSFTLPKRQNRIRNKSDSAAEQA